MLVQKVRRLTIRFRNAAQERGRKHEIGVTTIVATREEAAGRETMTVKRAQRKRSTIIVRKETREEANALGLSPADPIERLVAEARERVFLLSRKAGGGIAQTSVLGRLAATGEISRRQYEAGVGYAEIVRAHDALLGQNVSGGQGAFPRDDEADGIAARTNYRSAMARYDRCRAALRDAGREDRMAAAVVDAVTVNNWELPELTPALRIGLNHLARTLDLLHGGDAPAVARRTGMPD